MFISAKDISAAANSHCWAELDKGRLGGGVDTGVVAGGCAGGFDDEITSELVVGVMLVDAGVVACVAGVIKLDSIDAGMVIVRVTPALRNISIVLGKRHGYIVLQISLRTFGRPVIVELRYLFIVRD